MSSASADTDHLLRQISEGDHQVEGLLLDRYRDRLRQLIRLRMDARLADRLDASDIVQETFLDAHRRLEEYARKRPIAFYPWLRRIACDRLADAERHHLGVQQRSVLREVSRLSASHAAGAFVDSGLAPSRVLVQEELVERVQQALNRLPRDVYDVLMVRFVERLSVRESAQALEISVSALKSRQLRALQKIKPYLEELGP